MAALWSVGGIPIFVDTDGGFKETIYGEQDILDAIATTLHFFGTKSVGRRMAGHVQGTTNMNNLIGLANVDGNVTILADIGSLGTYRIRKIEWERRQALGDPDAWYYARLELTQT